ncbi:MAG: phenylalanine--tRNA ligase subunit beta [Candidatus Altiarchaeota archaeon]|nr:phenylalanine--tRNA ligase subunit beta [Candidatus Altiarchaeota archaeon]
MPTVEFDTAELMRLVGKKMPLDELEYKAAMLGTSVEQATEDKMVVEVFPNRPDMLSVEGFARALRNFIGSGGYKEYKAVDSPLELKVDKSVKGIRPYVVSAAIKNIKITDEVLISIMQVQEALHSSHGRKRAKVAIGIHDMDKTTPPYEYKAVKPNSMHFVPLDYSEGMSLKEVLEKHPKGEKYRHIIHKKELYPVILDKEGVVSLPPIINAERTRVTSSTKNLFIEMTGTNKRALQQTLNIVATSLADRGGEIVAVKVGGERMPSLKPEVMRIRANYAKMLLGVDMEGKNLEKLLGKMGYGLKNASETVLDVLVPPYRSDVLHPMDIVEDLAIAYGYENFAPKETDMATVGEELEFEAYSSKIRNLMIGLGFQEIVSFALTNEDALKKAGLVDTNTAVRIKNPRTVDFTLVRPSLIPGMLDTLAYNKKKRIPQKLFELDDVVAGKKDYANRRRLCFCILDWEVNFSQAQSVVESLLGNIKVGIKLRGMKAETFIPGRCAEIVSGKDRIGILGEVHPQVLENFGIEYPVAMAELDIGRKKPV